MGRKKKSTSPSSSFGQNAKTKTIMNIPYYGVVSYGFDHVVPDKLHEDDYRQETVAADDDVVIASSNCNPNSPSPETLSSNSQSQNYPLSLVSPPPTPISSKRRNSVHNQQRKSRTLDLLINPTEKKLGQTPTLISPLTSPSPGNSSHFSLKSPSPTHSLSHSRSNTSKSSQKSKQSIPPELECADYMEVPKVSSNITGDWATSRALKLAMNSDDDDFTNDLTTLITHVCEHNPREPSKIFIYFPSALKLLLQLHRELKCPPHLHESFWIAHRTPSHANLATVLSRIIQLAESRVLLFDLLKACMGNPSPRLLTRMLEDSKRKQEEKVANTDLFARLNFFGQSSDQIRARARATTAYSTSSLSSSNESNTLPKDLDELRLLIRGTSQQENTSKIVTIAPRNSQILKPSQMIQIVDPITTNQIENKSEQQVLLKRFVSSKVPSMEMITEDHGEEEEEEEEEDDGDIFAKGPGEGDGEEEDGEASTQVVDERMRQESIRKFVQARFSGRESGTHFSTRAGSHIPSFNSSLSSSFTSNDETPAVESTIPSATMTSSRTPFAPAAATAPAAAPAVATTTTTSKVSSTPPATSAPSTAVPIAAVPNMTPNTPPLSPSIAPRHRSSKRISMQCVHPKLLEKICHEWMASVPWHVPVFICNEKTIAISQRNLNDSNK